MWALRPYHSLTQVGLDPSPFLKDFRFLISLMVWVLTCGIYASSRGPHAQHVQRVGTCSWSKLVLILNISRICSNSAYIDIIYLLHSFVFHSKRHSLLQSSKTARTSHHYTESVRALILQPKESATSKEKGTMQIITIYLARFHYCTQ